MLEESNRGIGEVLAVVLVVAAAMAVVGMAESVVGETGFCMEAVVRSAARRPSVI